MQNQIKKRAYIYGIVAILLATVLAAMFLINIPGSPSQHSNSVLRTFTSSNEIRNFLRANSNDTQGTYAFLGPYDRNAPGTISAYVNIVKDTAVTPTGLPSSESASGPQYSTTNIQVAGVDEADIVKTDGTYAYVLSGNKLFLLRVYPPEEAQMLSNITFDSNVYPIEIFQKGDRLAVLASKYTVSRGYLTPYNGPSVSYWQYFIDVKTFVEVYDIFDRSNPQPLENYTMSGSYFNSRMIGDYIYFVVSQPVYIIYDTVVLPKVYTDAGMQEVAPSEIQYFNSSDAYYMFTSIVALNMQNTSEKPTRETLMIGGTSTMYVSLNNIYITFWQYDETAIYRIHIQNSTILPEAKGQVPGQEINQFSMDEYGEYFRIATATWLSGTQQSNVYILNMNLTVVGSLENIATGENMDSTRFIGNRCYLSTSTPRKDPFFVIDIANATEPRILGSLSIPGFTRYLHPYDDTHIIGVGVNGNNQVEISLYDLSNVSTPVKVASYIVPGTSSYTDVFNDHKAFLFDKSKDLLAIPVSTYGSFVVNGSIVNSNWQGMYVFNITLNQITLKGVVSHQNNSTYYWSSYWVKRAFYIENVFYTVSDAKVQLNDLATLALIEEIDLS